MFDHRITGGEECGSVWGTSLRQQRRLALAAAVLPTIPLIVLSARGFLWGTSVLARVERQLEDAR